MRCIDRDVWVGRDPETGEVFGFSTEAEAYQHWQDYGDTGLFYTVFNDAEGWSRPLNDEFADMLVADRCEDRAWQRHVDSYARAS